ncbi:MAG TPA: hypothetical protein VK550_05065 [Polyangiaceae bacterium]|nr:hypothetical protein [Polyangiaceae bacterium]
MPSSDDFIAEICREFPRFCIIPKRESRLSRVIDVALKLLTFGAQREFMTRYHTVLWDRLYVPELWDRTPELSRVITLRHERIHLRQRRRYGDWVMTFLYLIPFFPLGLAYGRARIEWEAYTETIRATAEYRGLAAARAPDLRRHILQQFTSGAYGWMWPFPSMLNRWYDEALHRIEAELRDPHAPQVG